MLLRCVAALSLLVVLGGHARSDDTLTAKTSETKSDEGTMLARGQLIYETQCASCHGGRGQGVEDQYSDPLVGDSSIAELSTLIAETMPEENPDSCVGAEADAVARFIHHEFYSEEARIRNQPPRQHFARLTGTQLQQSLADLYGSFQGDPWIEREQGIRGRYYTTQKTSEENQKIQRVDPVLDFDFGHEGPGEGIDPKEFRIIWDGSLVVEHTGRYELIVRSTCSMQFWFGQSERLLVDNHVQSEGKDEFRRFVTLLAGRQYPIRIDFKQRKRKTELPEAKFSLAWVPPGGVEQVIPTRHLIAKIQPSTFAISTKLPPDDESYGYERGTDINTQWDESTSRAAVEFAEVAVSELWPQYRRRHRKESDENRAKLRGFLDQLIRVAFRGSVDSGTRALYIDRQLAAEPDDAMAIKRVCLLTIKSPRFLYPTLDLERTPSQRAANRLALVLFDSLPTSDWLAKSVEKDQLKDESEIRRAAEKMVRDPRVRGKVLEMLYDWLDLDPAAQITKDTEVFSGFDPVLVTDLRQSLDAFLSEIVWSDASDYRQLFLADWSFTNQRLSEFYGQGWKPEQDFDSHRMVRSVKDPNRHLGILSHPMFLSELAYNRTSSPIHRGVFLIRHALGRTLRPPNEAFTPINPDLHPKLTTRQRVEKQTGEVNCQVCHQKINSLGFVLENYDAVGRFRTKEKGIEIDATGQYISSDGETVNFKGPRDLAEYLAQSLDSHESFIEHAFEHFTKQPVAAFGPDTAEELLKRFRESDCNIRNLIVEIAVIAALEPLSQAS